MLTLKSTFATLALVLATSTTLVLGAATAPPAKTPVPIHFTNPSLNHTKQPVVFKTTDMHTISVDGLCENFVSIPGQDPTLVTMDVLDVTNSKKVVVVAKNVAAYDCTSSIGFELFHFRLVQLPTTAIKDKNLYVFRLNTLPKETLSGTVIAQVDAVAVASYSAGLAASSSSSSFLSQSQSATSSSTMPTTTTIAPGPTTVKTSDAALPLAVGSRLVTAVAFAGSAVWYLL